MLLKDIISKIEEEISIRQAEDFDNVGLLIGNTEREITGILICHDALEAVVDEAVAKNINLIVCFHPIIFSGLKSLSGKSYVERAVVKAIENKIAVYAVHTAWDNDYFGVNYGICEALQLKNQKILIPKPKNLMQLSVYVPADYSEKVKEAAFAAGAGKIGFYDECSFMVKGRGTFRPLEGAEPFTGSKGHRENTEEDMLSFVFEHFQQKEILTAIKSAHPYEEVAYQIYRLDNENQYAGLGRYGELESEMDSAQFLGFVKQKLNLKIIRHTQNDTNSIKKVGVLGGSGAGGLRAAISAGCDAYLTGDLKYHDFYQSEDKILVCDIGHFESEQFVTQQLFEVLSKKFPKFAILKSDVNTNPVNYFL